jgi:hypothetical protein
MWVRVGVVCLWDDYMYLVVFGYVGPRGSGVLECCCCSGVCVGVAETCK